LTNNEIGLKSEFFDHRAQVNLSGYIMDWKNVQLPLFDPTGLGNTTFVVNGPSYRIKGIELQVVARVTEGLTVQGSSSWNSSEQTNAPCLIRDVGVANSANPTRNCAGLFAPPAVQRACALRLRQFRRLQAVHDGGCEPCRQHAQRAGELPSGQRFVLYAGADDNPLSVHHARLHDL
jgi:hypothetical protein